MADETVVALSFVDKLMFIMFCCSMVYMLTGIWYRARHNDAFYKIVDQLGLMRVSMDFKRQQMLAEEYTRQNQQRTAENLKKLDEANNDNGKH